MVLGETQIVGQMKKAEKLAHDCRGLGVMLNHLFQSTFTVAKEVRTATAIGANSVSLAAAAVRLALRLYGNLKDENVLFVGAGEMIELCAAHFAAQSPKSITIANRTMEKGRRWRGPSMPKPFVWRTSRKLSAATILSFPVRPRRCRSLVWA